MCRVCVQALLAQREVMLAKGEDVALPVAKQAPAPAPAPKKGRQAGCCSKQGSSSKQ